jgi:hypothetical protein
MSLSFSETEVLADIAIANQIEHSHSISSYLAAVTAEFDNENSFNF